MTTSKLGRLWIQQNWPWLRLVMATCLLVSLLMAGHSTYNWQENHARSERGERINAADFVKHPESFQIAGQPAASLQAYYDHLDQYFWPGEYTSTNPKQAVRAHQPNRFYYVLALIGGLLLAFYGRRTHRFEFMTALGATRWQIWWQQVRLALALMATIFVSQLIYYGWIIAVIPQTYQHYRNLPAMFGSSVAVTLVSGCLLMLGWLVGNLNHRLWLAILISGLTWRWASGMLTRTNIWLRWFNIQTLPDIWLHVHYGVSATMALVGLLILLGLTWISFRHWSADIVTLHQQSRFNAFTAIVLFSLGIGSTFGDMLLLPLMKTIAPWYELVGISLVLFGLLVYYGGHRYQGIGGLTR
ncbi:ABC transporter permease [Lactiplantibacillus pentosus]|uniref:ABC transporter permease n=1 Tax=Lactiplantibacillus pentosus TaxID=1589 RepID=UPI00207A7C1D|nr:ABC transporter permease [Lactiplantibacillus pentosus]USJ84935.1 ABC transporter permease [Lactiplantibacillus pentosus]